MEKRIDLLVDLVMENIELAVFIAPVITLIGWLTF
jgi:hypothetical protein